MAYNNPGALFIGAMYQGDRAFFQAVLERARKAGYERFVEPCSGTLSVSCYAADAGFERIEASDVTMFSGILGRYAEGRGIGDMGIRERATGRPIEGHVDALYESKRAMLEAEAGSEYGLALLEDFEAREAEVREEIRAQLDAIRSRVRKCSYRDMDMMDHLAEVADDERAVVVVNMPTFKGGYEKSYKAVSDRFEWNEPKYTVFDPKGGYEAFWDFAAHAKCLILSYQEAVPGQFFGEAVYARPSGRIGLNSYICTNRSEEVERLLGKSCAVKTAGKREPLKYPIVPSDYEITRKSRLSVVRAKPENIRYYRGLFTRNFGPSQASSGYALLVDGYVVGVFGYLTLSNCLDNSCDSVFIGFAITTSASFRASKLIHMVACQRSVVAMELSDVQMLSARKVRTAMRSKHASCTELRGVMRLVDRKKDDAMGNMLTYEADIQDKTLRQVLSEFMDKEERCRRS